MNKICSKKVTNGDKKVTVIVLLIIQKSITDKYLSLLCPFAAITNLNCWFASMRFCTLRFGNFIYSSMQSFSNSARLAREYWWQLLGHATDFQLDLNLGFDLAFQNTNLLFSPSYPFVVLALWFGSLFCWKIFFVDNCQWLADWKRIFSKVCLHIWFHPCSLWPLIRTQHLFYKSCQIF